MSYYERVADLPLSVASVEFERRERETTKFTRATTVVSLSGADEVGRGEDVTYGADLQPIPDRFDLAGEDTLESFSEKITGLDLFPGVAVDHEAFRNYRRWAFESAALDLALRQADTNLGAELDREYDPVRFVASPVLGDPPSPARAQQWKKRDPNWSSNSTLPPTGPRPRCGSRGDRRARRGFQGSLRGRRGRRERGPRPLSSSGRSISRGHPRGSGVDARDRSRPRLRPGPRVVGLPDNGDPDRPRPAVRAVVAHRQALAVRVGGVATPNHRVLRRARRSDVRRRPVRTGRGPPTAPPARVAFLSRLAKRRGSHLVQRPGPPDDLPRSPLAIEEVRGFR